MQRIIDGTLFRLGRASVDHTEMPTFYLQTHRCKERFCGWKDCSKQREEGKNELYIFEKIKGKYGG